MSRVAIYIRKSRGEIEHLEKHREQLIELADRNNWRYDIYQEIGTSDSIIKRKEFSRLLDKIENDCYSKILVVALDRLSRNEQDQADIFQIMKEHDVKIVTPSKVYDLKSENDILMSDFEKLIARQEFRLIKKRLRLGKENGAKQGRWTNGIPPIPYDYDKVNQELVINPDKLKIYRLIIQKALEGYSTSYIAYQLNTMDIKSPYGSVWHNNTINRILVDKTQLGKIIYDDKEYDGLHEPVKTLEEHAQIVLFLNNRSTNKNRKALKHTYLLNGLIKCGICGHTMSTYKRSNGEYSLKKCWYTTPYGQHCNNSGSTSRIILDSLKSSLNEHISALERELNSGEESENNRAKVSINSELGILRANYDKLNKKIAKVKDMILEEIYDTREGKSMIKKIELQNDKLSEDIKVLEIQLASLNNINKEQSIINAKEALDILYNNSDESEANKILKTVIKSITWTRKENDINIDIEFL